MESKPAQLVCRLLRVSSRENGQYEDLSHVVSTLDKDQNLDRIMKVI